MHYGSSGVGGGGGLVALVCVCAPAADRYAGSTQAPPGPRGG